MKKICTKPFKKIEISSDGKVYTCCPSYINKSYYIGNILSDDVSTVDDIWNSKIAQEIRNNILNEDYSMCNLNLCRERFLEDDTGYTTTPPLPEYVTLAYDRQCNIQCITCRDQKIKDDKKNIELYDKKMDSILLPLLNNARIISLSGSGEAFYSKHTRDLIKKLTRLNSTVKFQIYTNGLLFDKNNCKQLGLENRIESVYFSIHALNETIYKKIMVGSNLKVVLKNLTWAAQQQRSGDFEGVTINTVISAINYQEIPELIELAKCLDISISFSIYVPWGTNLDASYSKYAIWEKEHPEHLLFVEILQKIKEINYNKCILPPSFLNLMNI